MKIDSASTPPRGIPQSPAQPRPTATFARLLTSPAPAATDPRADGHLTKPGREGDADHAAAFDAWGMFGRPAPGSAPVEARAETRSPAVEAAPRPTSDADPHPVAPPPAAGRPAEDKAGTVTRIGREDAPSPRRHGARHALSGDADVQAGPPSDPCAAGDAPVDAEPTAASRPARLASPVRTAPVPARLTLIDAPEATALAVRLPALTESEIEQFRLRARTLLAEQGLALGGLHINGQDAAGADVRFGGYRSWR